MNSLSNVDGMEVDMLVPFVERQVPSQNVNGMGVAMQGPSQKKLHHFVALALILERTPTMADNGAVQSQWKLSLAKHMLMLQLLVDRLFPKKHEHAKLSRQKCIFDVAIVSGLNVEPLKLQWQLHVCKVMEDGSTEKQKHRLVASTDVPTEVPF